MLRTTILLLALSLQSFNSPMAEIRPAAFTAGAIETIDKAELTFEKKELAFTQHVEQVYQEAGLESKGLSFAVFQKAFVGFINLKQQNLVSPSKAILTVIDFTKSSNHKRLWVIDLSARKLLYNTLVSHGKNTGNVKAEKFSNVPNSNMSSLGFYVTDKTYYGKHGLSLRLQGMDEGFNSNAMERAIVVHGADYATSDFIKQHGRLGRSLGCPALPTEISKEVIDVIKDETVLFLHHSDQAYTSDYLNMELAIESFAADLPLTAFSS